MPLTDVVRYLNARDRESRPHAQIDDPFVAVPQGAVARYARITLSSSYAPIRSGQGDNLYGHAAVLTAHGELNNLLLHPEAIFAIPSTNEEFVHLDRLVRTLHAINYLLHRDAQHLFVKVNLRHIQSVPGGHGEAFENALRASNLEPTGITLLINVENDSNPALRSALASYRARGYQIALSRHGYNWRSTAWLKELQPNLVVLDNDLLEDPQRLAKLVSRLHADGLRTLIGIDGSPTQIQLANDARVDLLQYPVIQEYERPLLSTQVSHYHSRTARAVHEEAAWLGV